MQEFLGDLEGAILSYERKDKEEIEPNFVLKETKKIDDWLAGWALPDSNRNYRLPRKTQINTPMCGWDFFKGLLDTTYLIISKKIDLDASEIDFSLERVILNSSKDKDREKIGGFKIKYSPRYRHWNEVKVETLDAQTLNFKDGCM